MFGHDSKPSRIFSYGALAPREGLDAVREQLKFAHRYRNALVEIELRRRERREALLRQLAPDLDTFAAAVAEAEAALEAEVAEAKKANARAKSKGASASRRPALRDLRAARTAATRAFRDYRREQFGREDVQAALAQLDDGSREEIKAARGACGVFWGTYLAVEQSMARCRTGPPPRFLRYTYDGRCVVQIQGGMSVPEVMGQDTRLRIGGGYPTDADPRGRRGEVWLRVGSLGREPVWAKVPVILHRPLPPDARVKWAWLQCKRVAAHEKWAVQVVLERAGGWARGDEAGDGEVGIDVGWRRTGGGLRAAVWHGSDGGRGSLTLPEEDLGRWAWADELRSIRDRLFNEARGRLSLWLASPPCAVPEWLTERTKFLGAWRSPGRLAAVVIRWRAGRFAGDAEIFEALEQWRRLDKRRWEEEANVRRKALAWRDHRYRNFARDLARRYHTARVEDTDWRALMCRPEPDDEADGALRTYTRIAAVGTLLRFVREAMAETVRVPSRDTTRTCHVCGHLNTFPDPADMVQTCDDCGRSWDQDDNAAENLLRAEAASSEVVDETPRIARVP